MGLTLSLREKIFSIWHTTHMPSCACENMVMIFPTLRKLASKNLTELTLSCKGLTTMIKISLFFFSPTEHFRCNFLTRKCNFTKFHRVIKGTIESCMFNPGAFPSQFRNHYFQLSIGVFGGDKTFLIYLDVFACLIQDL